ncbi:MAG TPA: hypothetical protein VJT84_12225 [Gaiellaceae bacterium]|nr:hypothetical protein [Gaiellaceae bacterium]
MTLAITWYQWFLFAHILAAAAWAGGALALGALAIAARRAAGTPQELELVRLAGKIGGPFFGVAGLALIGFGIALVENGNWGYDKFFVQFGFGAWAFSTLVGIFYYGREQKGIEATLARGADDPEVRRRLNRYYLVGRLDALVLVVAVFVMATKPWL